MDLTYLLKSARIFADLDADELAAVQQIAARQEYRKGQTVFLEGQPARGFFLVAAGQLKIYRVGPDGRERVLHVVEAGDSFAEAALFMDTYPATAEALAPTTVVFVDGAPFKQLLTRDPRLTLKIFGALVRWLAVMRNAVTDLTLKEVPARFASYVLSHSNPSGQPLTVAISKTTVAQMIGTTKETFSRLLQRLAKERVLTYRGHQIRILDRRRLERIASGEERV